MKLVKTVRVITDYEVDVNEMDDFVAQFSDRNFKNLDIFKVAKLMEDAKIRNVQVEPNDIIHTYYYDDVEHVLDGMNDDRKDEDLPSIKLSKDEIRQLARTMRDKHDWTIYNETIQWLIEDLIKERN